MLIKVPRVDAVNPEYLRCSGIVSALVAAPHLLPTLPKVTLDIRHALDRRENSIASISEVINRDADLSSLLLRYAGSVMLHSYMPPQTVFDVVRILGMGQVERIIMLHAVKTMFSGNTQAYTRLFVVAWERLIKKASMSALIAKKVGEVAPDYALLGSVLSEVGNLAVLAAFKVGEQKLPSAEMYNRLCHEFAKSLTLILLKQWEMDEEYSQLANQVGDWKAAENEPFDLVDAVNLGHYHSLKGRATEPRLPAIKQLSAYHKLSDTHNAITDTYELELVVLNRDEMLAIANSLYA